MFVEEYLVDLRRSRFSGRACLAYARRCAVRARANLLENPQLARSVGVSALGVLAGAFAWALVLSFTLSEPLARRFLVAQAVWVGLTIGWLLLHIGLLRDAGGRMPRRLSAATVLTLVRLELVPSLVTLLLARQYALATAVFLACGVTDVLDGWAARHWHQETRLGIVLDLLADLAVGSAVYYGAARMQLVPPWVFALLAARYLLLLAGATYILLFHGPITIRPTVFGKLSGVIVTALTTLLLLSPVLWNAHVQGQIRDLTGLAVGLLFLANTVQILLIGIVNLRQARLPRVAAVRLARIRPAS